MEALTDVFNVLVGLGSVGVIYLARRMSALVNAVPRPGKWAVNIGVVSLLSWVGGVVGVQIDSLATIANPEVAEPLASFIISTLTWQVTKQLLRWKNMYSTDLDGKMIHS